MKVIRTKDKCLTAISEKPVAVTDDSKWAEMDGNAIANLHMALPDGVLSSIEEKKTAKDIWDPLARLYEARSLQNNFSQGETLCSLHDEIYFNYLVFNDVAGAILKEENRRNNREDKQTSSRQVEALVVTRGRSMETGSSGSHNYAVANEGKKRFVDVWLYDTGATFHMTTRREWFHQYKPIFGGGSVYSCNDHELKIIRIGSIMVKMYDGTVRTIRDVRHVEGLKKNKLSIGQLDDLGCKILVKRKLLPGLTKVSLPFCEHCVISKQHRLKFETSNSRSLCVLELVHSDVWQTSVQSLRGAKYFVSFIDDYSMRCWVYPIKKKSDLFEVFKVYKTRVELDFEKKIKCLRTNNESEYTSDEFDTFCKQEGIKRQFTRAYTPQQNGVAERMNRTLLERARAMLATASLEKSFWAEAVNTSCYVINRPPSTAVELKTPMEMWTGKPGNYSDLHIFGSPVYVMYNTQETTKLDPKFRKCLFLGYADGVKGYHLWDPTAHKVVVSIDVLFMKEKIQENEEGDSTARETTSIQMEMEFQSNDSFESAPQHEVNETNESHALATRTLNRERKRSRWHSDYVMESNKEAMQEEIRALYKNKTWELVSLPGGRKPIGNKWVYKIKRNGDDHVERYRARLVVKGYAQKEGIDLSEKFSHVVRMTTIRVVLASRCWYKRFDSFIMSLKYNRLHADPCVYFKRFGNNDFIILLLYVDDMLVASPNKDHINKLTAQLTREFEMKDLGPANKILGVQIHRDIVSRKFWLSQKSYVKKILQRFNMQDCKPISTLFPTNVKLSSKMSPSSEKERMEMSRVPYASAVGSLMFVMICTGPDIAHAVGVVSRYMTKPGREHWEAVKRIFRYIKGTSDVALCFGESDLIVKGYVDSDYAGDIDGSKSTTGYLFALCGGTVSWVSKLQSVVAMSKTKAEYVATAQASKEAVWLKMLLEELGHKQ
nr:retrovirus-related Pol polyprotein from transposon TNT 1-94 [Tanacetum cinerariifolium]